MDKSTLHYYFAYGSNLNSIQMQYHCRTAKLIGTSELQGYRLSFNGPRPGKSFLTIEPTENSVVPIGIYLLTNNDEKRLDIYEGYPTLYYKQYITIPFKGEEITGLIYVMHKIYEENPPATNYFYICLDGYKQFNFDRDILGEALKRADQKRFKSLNKIPEKKDC